MWKPRLKGIVDYSVRGAAVFGLSSFIAPVCIFIFPFINGFIIFPIGFVLSGVSIGLFFPTWKKPARSKLFAAIGFGLGFIIPGIAVMLSMIALQAWEPRYGSYAIHHAVYWGVGFGIAGAIGTRTLFSSLKSVGLHPSVVFLAVTGVLGMGIGGEIGGLLGLELFYLLEKVWGFLGLLLGFIVSFIIGGALIGASLGWLESTNIRADSGQGVPKA